jgi:hypothetical protein
VGPQQTVRGALQASLLGILSAFMDWWWLQPPFEGFVFCAALGFSERAWERRYAYSRGAPRGGGCNSCPTHLALSSSHLRRTMVRERAPPPCPSSGPTRATQPQPSGAFRSKIFCAYAYGSERRTKPLPTCRKRVGLRMVKAQPAPARAQGAPAPTP